jgi:anthranilate synthase component 1
MHGTISFEEFSRLARQGNIVPIGISMLADMMTPVSAFLRLSQGQRYGFLLESVEGGEKMARYSFLGVAPAMVVRYRRSAASSEERLSIHREAGAGAVLPDDYHQPLVEMERNEANRAFPVRKASRNDIFSYLQTAAGKFRPVRVNGLPRFSGGFVGYLGYDTVRDLEKLRSPKAAALDPAGAQNNSAAGEHNAITFPDAEFGFYDTVLAFDHARQRMQLITHVFLEEGELNLRRRYEEAVERLETLQRRLSLPFPPPENPPDPRAAAASQRPEPRSNFSHQNFLAAVARAKEYIAAGDIFQVVLSQRFRCSITVSPFQIYRALRLINPSPYMYFLKHGDNCLIGSSPEALLRVENRVAEVRPIAGTRRRGMDESEDQRLEEELRTDEKERAEHLMLVDLSRNDLGRVCEFASVEANELMVVERYSHVMHLVSNVRGKLRPELEAIAALRACFPAGTVSGAPKIRAMEIIDELEPERRGPYAGAVGYFDFSGNLDTCITIRTIWTQGNQAFFQAGAGIVADSDPGREYQETIEKARAVWNAIDLAERGLEA